MRPILFLLFLGLFRGPAPVAAQADEREVLAIVHQLFDAMRARDTARMRSLLHPEARLASPGMRNGVFAVTVVSPDVWLGQVARATGGVLDERITGAEVKVDGALASVWTAYSFYIGERFSHCGVDAFHLVRMPEGWRIIDLADTRRRDGCAPPGDSLMGRLQGALDSLRGPDTRYGLGVIIWPDESGGSMGHSGFFPGYRTDMRYFPEGGFAVALQVNTSNPKGLGRTPGAMLTAIASIVRRSLPAH